MDAIITDINEYRRRKNGATHIDAFAKYSDRSIQTRHRMLKFIEEGHTELTDTSQAVPRMSFPNGFDPENHAEDNINAVYAEGVRRGVFVKSE